MKKVIILIAIALVLTSTFLYITSVWKHVAMLAISSYVYRFNPNGECYMKADYTIHYACMLGIKANQAQCTTTDKYSTDHTLVEYYVNGENYFIDPTFNSWISNDLSAAIKCTNEGKHNWVVDICSTPNIR